MKTSLVRPGIYLPTNGVLPVPRISPAAEPKRRVRLCGISFANDSSWVRWGPVLEYPFAEFAVTVRMHQEIGSSFSARPSMISSFHEAEAEIAIRSEKDGTGLEGVQDLWWRWDYVAVSLDYRGRSLQFLSLAHSYREMILRTKVVAELSLRIFDAVGLGHRWVTEGDLPTLRALPEGAPALPGG